MASLAAETSRDRETSEASSSEGELFETWSKTDCIKEEVKQRLSGIFNEGENVKNEEDIDFCVTPSDSDRKRAAEEVVDESDVQSELQRRGIYFGSIFGSTTVQKKRLEAAMAADEQRHYKRGSEVSRKRGHLQDQMARRRRALQLALEMTGNRWMALPARCLPSMRTQPRREPRSR